LIVSTASNRMMMDDLDDSDGDLKNENYEDSRVELRAMGHNLVCELRCFQFLHMN
jgi:hypothetical protein